MNKLIFAQSEKWAEALAIAVPEFADADVHIGFGSNVRDKIEDKVVLTHYIPDNMVSKAKQVVLCQYKQKKETADLLDAEQLAIFMSDIQPFKANDLSLEEAKREW